LQGSGNDDDAVPQFAGAQTPLSQEAVMLGIVGELRKHRVQFTVIRATDPLDQLFLARYLRQAYPKGRVVVTSPDLLLARQEDSVLHGVLGLGSYSLVPGLDESICQVTLADADPLHSHENKIFVSRSSLGTYNAAVALLERIKQDRDAGKNGTPKSATVPLAPYIG